MRNKSTHSRVKINRWDEYAKELKADEARAEKAFFERHGYPIPEGIEIILRKDYRAWLASPAYERWISRGKNSPQSNAKIAR